MDQDPDELEQPACPKPLGPLPDQKSGRIRLGYRSEGKRGVRLMDWLTEYTRYIRDLRGLSPHTVKAYLSDLQILEDFLQGEELALAELDRSTAGGFIAGQKAKGYGQAQPQPDDLHPTGILRLLPQKRGTGAQSLFGGERISSCPNVCPSSSSKRKWRTFSPCRVKVLADRGIV
jgi:hypothetical protein